jgi:hypothetical protein
MRLSCKTNSAQRKTNETWKTFFKATNETWMIKIFQFEWKWHRCHCGQVENKAIGFLNLTLITI